MASQKDVAERVESAKVLVNGRLHHSQVRRALMKTYDVSRAQADRYIKRAKELIAAEVGRPAQSHREDAYSFYRGILTDKNASIRDKIKAQERLDKLLGLEMPVKVARTDSDGNDIPLDQVASELDTLIAELDRAERAEKAAADRRGTEG